MQFEGNKLRHEYKYYINYEAYQILRTRLIDIIGRDENMDSEDGYLVSSLYFDDIYDSAMEEKLAGTRFRKKFRIRVYERNDKQIKLECKMKYDTYISKISASLSSEEYTSILSGDYEFLAKRKEAVCLELYMLRKTSLLKPVLVVEYRREAYVSNYGNVRITFDKDIAVSYDSLDMLYSECPVTGILPEGRMVLEVKYDDYLPSYIGSLLQIGEAEKCAISKYVMCRKQNFEIKNY